MILLWGAPADPPMAAVRAALHRLRPDGRPIAFVDQTAALETAVDLSVSETVAGRVWAAGVAVDLGAVTAAYVRPYDSRQLPAVRAAGEGSLAWRHALEVEDALLSWADLAPALVLNRPEASATNNSKPYQAAWIRSRGFATPDTLVTTDARAAREFWDRHGSVIYKSVSGVRSIVSRLGPHHRERLEDVVWCPTQFQEYVAGTDYRAHVVGDEVFACEIVTEADDYRYAGRRDASVAIRPYDLPPDCADRCRRLAAALGLPLAGVDLRRAPSGEWYCFEVNPSPGFTYYQDATGQPIDDAVARLLTA